MPRRRPVLRSGRWLVPLIVAEIVVPRSALAQPACPDPAALRVFVQNLSDDPAVDLTVAGDLLDDAATCAGAGAPLYRDVALHCVAPGPSDQPIACDGVIGGLRPGAWVHRLRVQVAGSAGAQVQARRAVLTGGGASNALVWPIYAGAFVVTQATDADLRDQLGKAAGFAATGRPALVTFDRGAFPGAGDPKRIELARDLVDCPAGRNVALCFDASRVVVDALDDRGSRGGVVWSVRASGPPSGISVLRIFGSENVFRGLVFDGSQVPNAAAPRDTVAIDGARGRGQGNRIEDSLVIGPSNGATGDAVSVEAGAGGPGDDAATNVIEASELRGAEDKGLKVTTGGHVVIRRSCVHDNRNGGIQSTQGGNVAAVDNLVQHNVPGKAQNGISVGSDILDQHSAIVTDGNVIRFSGAEGIVVASNGDGMFRNDYVADNEIAGAHVWSKTPGAPLPTATFRGVAFVCNHNGLVSRQCQTAKGVQVGPACVVDADCTPPATCPSSAPSPPVGLGAVADTVGCDTCNGANAPCCTPPMDVDYGTPVDPGRNAFGSNVLVAAAGANLMHAMPVPVLAAGNQWEHCVDGAGCDPLAILGSDVRPAGALVDVGTPVGARTGRLRIDRVSPARPAKGDVVRIFGDDFDAIDGNPRPLGVAGPGCPTDAQPLDPCSPLNAKVNQANKGNGGNRIELAIGGQTVDVDPDAVTPTMIVFRMPVDCWAPGTLRLSRGGDPAGSLSNAFDFCDPAGCDGVPDGIPCDDGNPCTVGDACRDGACAGAPGNAGAVCRPAAGPCDVAETCTGASADCPANLLRPSAAVCRRAGGECDVAETCTGTSAGCPPNAKQPAGTECADDGNPCTVDVCDGASAGCQHRPGNVGAVCRAASDVCDVAEKCNGSAICPADEFAPPTVECRPAAGACDVAEHCTGTGAACTADAFVPAGVECRASAGACDPAEVCTGVAATCPPDAKSTAICRSSTGPCDLAERCDGIGDACPPDAFVPSGVVCRTAVDPCGVSDACTGSSAVCPHALKTGCDAVVCGFERAMPPLECAEESVPAGVGRLFRRAGELMKRECPATRRTCAKAKAALRKVLVLVDRAAHRRRSLSAACTAVLRRTVDDARDRLGC